MNFKAIFDKTIPIEKTIREQIEDGVLTESIKNTLMIQYKFNLLLVKPKEEKQPEQQAPNSEPAAVPNDTSTTPTAPVGGETPVPMDTGTTPDIANTDTQTPPEGEPNPQQDQENSQGGLDLSLANASVVTEDKEDKKNENIKINCSGLIKLNSSQKDKIDDIDDIVDIISEKENKKQKEGSLNDFALEVLELCLNQNFNELKGKIDKSSKIFIEVYYGKKFDKTDKKLKDSVGIRFSKRANSDTLSSVILIDNSIMNMKFNINKVNQRIIQYRNSEVGNFSFS